MDLLPGASLELRIYVILGLVGVMFFAAILALAVGRFMSIKSASQLDSLAGDTVFGGSSKPEKQRKEKKVRASRKSAPASVEDLIVEDKPKPEKKQRKEKAEKPQRHFFGKKKVDAVQMLSAPSGYEEEYAATSTRNFDSDIPEVVEYTSDGDFSSGFPAKDDSLINYLDTTEVEGEITNSYDELDDWNSPSEETQTKDSEDEKRKKSDSPFGGADDWEFQAISMTPETKKPPSGFIYAIISVSLALSLPLTYGLFVALNATQDFTTGIISGEYENLDDYLYGSIITTDYILTSQALMWGGMLVGPFLAALRKVKLWLDDTKVLALGFRAKWIWVGLLVGIGAQAILLTFGALIQSAYPDSGLEGNAGEILETFSGLNIAAILFMVVLGAPIVEEILYRGLVFTAISNKFGVLAGGVVSSLIFGFSHVSSFSINGIFTGLATAVLGGVLVYARVKGKGLFLPIMIHFTFNGISGLAILAAETLL